MRYLYFLHFQTFINVYLVVFTVIQEYFEIHYPEQNIELKFKLQNSIKVYRMQIMTCKVFIWSTENKSNL